MLLIILNTLVAVLRVPIYAIFYWKTKRNHFCNYYPVWLLAIAAWVHDGVCLYYTIVQPEELDETLSFFESIAFFIHFKAILILATGVWYCLTFIKNIRKEQEEGGGSIKKERLPTLFTFPLSRYKLKWGFFFLSVTFSTLAYASDYSNVTKDTPFPNIQFPPFHSVLQYIILFVKKSNKRSDGKIIHLWNIPSSFLVYLCFTTTIPINTLFQSIFLLWNTAMSSSTWMNTPTMTVVSWDISIVEIMILAQSLYGTETELIYWPHLDDDNRRLKRGYENIA
ncbi:hypothetical protein BDA99DRAFT_498993 [Phascolomyces articulosus]|uniref:Uncharacterized protein n=1 Tax=Phascolomyces articulosus TaxID=60185 RepID=A0AAD5K7L5_9FUNG|nr:hypothetical protein BDA99DRAFT_498993 [Phascolomyces articulosus]